MLPYVRKADMLFGATTNLHIRYMSTTDIVEHFVRFERGKAPV